MLELLSLILALLWAVFTTISVSMAVIVLGALLFFILKEEVFNERT